MYRKVVGEYEALVVKRGGSNANMNQDNPYLAIAISNIVVAMRAFFSHTKITCLGS